MPFHVSTTVLVASDALRRSSQVGKRGPCICLFFFQVCIAPDYVMVEGEKLSFFVDSAFVKIGDFIAHLVKGIFMGPKCSPSLSNLYLHVCEANYLSTLGQAERRLFRFIWRFIDDLLIVNHQHFDEHAAKMYHPTLALTDEGEKFLDIALHRVLPNRLGWDVFDKRRAFPFKVIRFPHFFSNIDLNTHKAVVFGQVLWFSYCLDLSSALSFLRECDDS